MAAQVKTLLLAPVAKTQSMAKQVLTASALQVLQLSTFKAALTMTQSLSALSPTSLKTTASMVRPELTSLR
jgi:hypothetical protein